MDLLQRTIDYIEITYPEYAPIYTIPKPEGKEGISIIIGPSKYREKYFSGATIDNMLIQVTVKNSDSEKAYNTICDIVYLLEKSKRNDIKSKTNSFCFIDCKIYTNPNFAYMDKNQTYTYVSLLNLTYERR